MDFRVKIKLLDLFVPSDIPTNSHKCSVVYKGKSHYLSKLNPVILELHRGESTIDLQAISEGHLIGTHELDMRDYIDDKLEYIELISLDKNPNQSFSNTAMLSSVMARVSLSVLHKLPEIYSEESTDRYINESVFSEEKLGENISDLQDRDDNNNESEISMHDREQINKKILELNTHLTKAITGRDELLESAKTYKEINEVAKLTEKITEISIERDKHYQEIHALKSEIQKLNASLLHSQSERSLLMVSNIKYKEKINILKETVENQSKALSEYARSAECDNEKINLLQSENWELQKELLLYMNNSKESSESKDGSLVFLFQNLEQKIREVDHLLKEREEVISELIRKEQDSNNSLKALLEEFKNNSQVSSQHNLKLKQELASMSEIISVQSKRNLSSASNIKELKSKIDILTEENKTLRKDMYIPHATDATDQLLAEFVNRKHPSISKYIIREEPNSYLLGNRRVNIKHHKDKLYIKSGSKFVQFEDFLAAQKKLSHSKSFVIVANSAKNTRMKSSRECKRSITPLFRTAHNQF